MCVCECAGRIDRTGAAHAPAPDPPPPLTPVPRAAIHPRGACCRRRCTRRSHSHRLQTEQNQEKLRRALTWLDVFQIHPPGNKRAFLSVNTNNYCYSWGECVDKVLRVWLEQGAITKPRSRFVTKFDWSIMGNFWFICLRLWNLTKYERRGFKIGFQDSSSQKTIGLLIIYDLKLKLIKLQIRSFCQNFMYF